jgi:probable F420-dependent oxidoreductase
MQFSIGFPLPNHPLDPTFITAEFLGEFARTAEAAGFSAIYFTEHPMPSDRWLQTGGHDALDPFVALGFAAMATTRLRLLTNLTVVPYRNPFLLAKTVATLDRLSGGRVTLGVGTGYLKPEYFALGVDFETRNAAFDESLEVLRLTWSGESVTYDGDGFSARANTALPTPVQDPLPIWIGGNSKLTLRRVATKAQGWMPMPNPRAYAAARRSAALETLEDLAELLGYLRAHADAAGRTAPIDVMYMTFDGGDITDDGFGLDEHLAALHAQADLGVTWNAVNASGSTRAEVLEMVKAYGRDVVAVMA